jgi:diamine N-acetyltransferase
MVQAAPRIRSATPDDLTELTTLARQVFQQTYGAAIPPAILHTYLQTAFTPARFAAQLQAEPALLRLAVDGDRLAGYARLDRTPLPGAPPGPEVIELAQLYLAEGWRGQGIGEALLEDACAIAQAERASSIWLCVWQQNERAQRFYQRHGFAVIDQIDIFVYDVAFHDLVMVRGL